jgi:hypothetical protein
MLNHWIRPGLKTYASFTVGGAGEKGVDPADLCDIICFNSYGGAEGIAEHCHKIWPDKTFIRFRNRESTNWGKPDRISIG